MKKKVKDLSSLAPAMTGDKEELLRPTQNNLNIMEENIQLIKEAILRVRIIRNRWSGVCAEEESPLHDYSNMSIVDHWTAINNYHVSLLKELLEELDFLGKV